MSRIIGILALARPTFDVEFANEMLSAMYERLAKTEVKLTGPRKLLMDSDAARIALDELIAKSVDAILVLQVTFTDAAMICEIGEEFAGDLLIWSVPEPRLGGRLRLNSFCGLNLASHALGLRGREFSYLHADPVSGDVSSKLLKLLDGKNSVQPVYPVATNIGVGADAMAVASSLQGTRIGRIGEHPEGFDTCAYNSDELRSFAGIEVEELGLDDLFERAKLVNSQTVNETREKASLELDEINDVDQEQLDKSLRLKSALEAIRQDGKHDAFAIRCWPETFTEYGGAVCGPVSMMGEARIPCACEADVYGALTQIVLQRTAHAPVFLTDLVDVDIDDDTAIVWHCGQAPVSMAGSDEKPIATVHSNRKMPLLYEFALKPGRVTFIRISQARGVRFMVIGTGEMLARPKAFTGTSGTVRFDNGSDALLENLIAAGIEHHMALAYGDHADELRQVAAALKLPVLEI
ncbi:MAG: L-fucose/L-arabinose isomerase family protein [Rhizobiaceae bacterium]